MKIIWAVILMFVVSSCAGPEKSSNPSSEISAGPQTSSEKIDREGIRKVFMDKQKELQTCYTDRLKTAKAEGQPILEGKLALDFEIGNDGSVIYAKIDEARSTLKDERLSKCLCDYTKKWTFPKPPDKQTVKVSYPLAFSSKK
jgi:hypothetical protein